MSCYIRQIIGRNAKTEGHQNAISLRVHKQIKKTSGQTPTTTTMEAELPHPKMTRSKSMRRAYSSPAQAKSWVGFGSGGTIDLA